MLVVPFSVTSEVAPPGTLSCVLARGTVAAPPAVPGRPDIVSDTIRHPPHKVLSLIRRHNPLCTTEA
ncbi:hypothetical protein GCM10020001_028010 [Nonomuraea salmonea]